MVAAFFDELADQPQALRRLIADYSRPAGRSRLAAVPTSPPPWLLGMGASYHAALVAVDHLRQRGFPAQACEATEALWGPDDLLSQARHVIYISQSGASAEVAPVLQRLPLGTHVTALTNDEASPLARRANLVLPLLADDEQTAATKTFANSLAALWLLGQHLTGGLNSADFAALENLADRLAALVEQAPGLGQLWIERLASANAYAVISAGLQAITARHAAMILMEWLKVPAVSASVGAFRHGPVEITQAGLGVVVFTAAGPAYESTDRLAAELEGYGAKVLVVEAGHPRLPAEPAPAVDPVDPGLATILNVVPVQIIAEALARRRWPAPGFRHIHKVVTVS